MAAVAGASEKESRVRLPNGATPIAELHWYEAAGIGRKEFKIKHVFEE
jgi:hypothetical protein